MVDRTNRLVHGETYELTRDTAWSYDELAAALSEVLGRGIVPSPSHRRSTSGR